MKKVTQLMWMIAAVILFILPFPLYNLLKENIDTKEHENRELAGKPELDLLALEDYPAAYDDWMNDNLPFRNQLIACNSLLSIYLFDESPSSKVIIGKNGWFFYNSSVNEGAVFDSIADFQGTNLFTDEELEAIRTRLLNTRDKLAEQDREFVLFIAPNKEQIYSDKMPDKYGELTEYTRAKQLCDYLKDDIRVVNVSDELIKAREKYPQYEFYLHLDTHWNNLGAYIGAKALADELGCELPDINELVITETNTGECDLAALMNLTEYLKGDVNYDITGYCEKGQKVVEYDYSMGYGYKTEEMDERKVMIIRDSFSTALAPFFAAEFNDTVLCHWTNYDATLIDTEQPDIVIYETVERYLNNLKTIKIVEGG